jgi:hypothetical protein
MEEDLLRKKKKEEKRKKRERDLNLCILEIAKTIEFVKMEVT